MIFLRTLKANDSCTIKNDAKNTGIRSRGICNLRIVTNRSNSSIFEYLNVMEGDDNPLWVLSTGTVKADLNINS